MTPHHLSCTSQNHLSILDPIFWRDAVRKCSTRQTLDIKTTLLGCSEMSRGKLYSTLAVRTENFFVRNRVLDKTRRQVRRQFGSTGSPKQRASIVHRTAIASSNRGRIVGFVRDRSSKRTGTKIVGWDPATVSVMDICPLYCY